MQTDVIAANDGQLLAEFWRTRSESLFEELVNRHGALVFNACLRVLNQRSDAEDAAQAVFVALAQKAGDRSLHARASLAGWLYASAWHIGVRARAAQKARARHEREAAAMVQNSGGAEKWQAIAPVLDGELHALPEKYRLALVLHHFQALSIEQIAAATRSSADAVKQRLCRGRELLRERLSRRGVTVSGALLPLLLQSQSTTATLPFSFAATTAHAAVAVAAGQAVASGLLAQRVLELARASHPALSRGAKLRLAAAAVVLVLLGGGVAAVNAFAPKPDAGVTRVRVPVAVSTSVSVSTGTPSVGTPETVTGTPPMVEVVREAVAPVRAPQTSDAEPRKVIDPEPAKKAEPQFARTSGPSRGQDAQPEEHAAEKLDLSKFVAATQKDEAGQRMGLQPPDEPKSIPPLKALPQVDDEPTRAQTPAGTGPASR